MDLFLLPRWPDRRGRQQVEQMEGSLEEWIWQVEVRRGDGSLKEAGWFGGGQSAARGARRRRQRRRRGLVEGRRSLVIIHSQLCRDQSWEMSLGRERPNHRSRTLFIYSFFPSVSFSRHTPADQHRRKQQQLALCLQLNSQSEFPAVLDLSRRVIHY